jgi:hypothetical protein
MAVVAERLMSIWQAHVCRSSWISSQGCEVFRGIIEVPHVWQCLVPGLKISSQETESLVLDDCKSACPRRNKISFLTEPLVWTKGKIFVHTLLPFASGEVWRHPSDDLLHLVLLHFGSNWGATSINLIWSGGDKRVKSKKNYWKSER